MRYTFFLGNEKVAEVFTRAGLNDASRLFGQAFFPHFGVSSYRQLIDSVGKQHSFFIGWQ